MKIKALSLKAGDSLQVNDFEYAGDKYVCGLCPTGVLVKKLGTPETQIIPMIVQSDDDNWCRCYPDGCIPTSNEQEVKQ